ncbi:polyadenylate-binding protein 1-like [Cucumis melo var. makuwa]|uniref:Polyadenylate-binding protein 1-like n=1 Tax=Cucumis melo var. makuwa TaxID=1194695 RepID=A0A5A7UBY1_CUCMM|nr:polyadenylate-binding protein 1-like [Cucumis melo var. makuwa]
MRRSGDRRAVPPSNAADRRRLSLSLGLLCRRISPDCAAFIDILVYSDPVEVVFLYQRRASLTGEKWWVSTNGHSWLGSDNAIPGGVVQGRECNGKAVNGGFSNSLTSPIRCLLKDLMVKPDWNPKGIYGGIGLNKLVHDYDALHARSSLVDYACTPEEVEQHFQSCGTVNRVTILTDKFGHPKGFAYVEFVEAEAVQEALLLNETKLHGRQLKDRHDFDDYGHDEL